MKHSTPRATTYRLSYEHCHGAADIVRATRPEQKGALEPPQMTINLNVREFVELLEAAKLAQVRHSQTKTR